MAAVTYIVIATMVLQNIFKSGDAVGLLPFSGLTAIEGLLTYSKEFPHLHDEIEMLIENDGLNQYKLGEDNEDKYLNATQLINKYGYEAEIHHVTTEDGYKLSMYRIPGDGEPVFIMHGLIMSAVDWLTVGPQQALPYLLADKGYDVWMGNARGSSVDSRGHVQLSAEDDVASYWDYSWDEIGRYDLPAMIDYVLQKTGQTALKYVGHSQGTTSFFVMCSEKPEYNEKISVMVALSPIAYMSHMKSPLMQLVSPAAGGFSEIIRGVIGFHHVNPQNPLVEILTKIICGNTELGTLVCNNMNFMVSGFGISQMNVTNLPVTYAHAPAGISSKQLFHYAQEIVSGEFEKYDYGFVKNLLLYGSTKPPSYKLEKVTAPVALFYSQEGDWFAAYKDVLKLRKRISDVVIDFYNVPVEDFCHTDFMWGKNARELVYNRVLKLLNKY